MSQAGTAGTAGNGSVCPRCHAQFACGAAGNGPCACATLALSPALLQGLRARYDGCLCLACLGELSARAEAVVDDAPAAAASRRGSC